MKLYETQSSLRENVTKVTACEEKENGIWIRLEDTVFFPEEGGQYADTGVIVCEGNEVKVTDGRIFNGEVWHKVEKPLPVGAEAKCRLDWELRFMKMQQHTGEHIITGLINRNFGYNNVGFHLSDDGPVTLDVDGTLTPEQIEAMELKANEIIYRNLPVTDHYPSKEELKDISYRSKIEIEGQVRLIIIGDPDDPADVCACCAPHVSRTGEVGMIKVISAQNYKGGMRLNILCGKRAFRYIQEEHRIMMQLANRFSTSMDKVISCVENHLQEEADLRFKVAELSEQSIIDRIKSMSERQNACLITDRELSPVTVKNIYNAMSERFSGYSGIFVGNDETGYRFNAGSRNRDSRELMKLMKESLGAKGGGSAEMIQGKTSAAGDIIEAFFNGLN